MNTNMKQQLTNDILTGLLIAATFAAVIPVDAFAQTDLNTLATNTQTGVGKPAVFILSLIAYVVGAVLVIAGIAGAKKHADNPGSNPLGPPIGKMLAGAALLVGPYMIGVLSQTGSETTGGGQATFVTVNGLN